jgi:cold-inducible RNA-binding protein
MSNRLFVGNLPYDATEDEIRDHFAQAGAVSRVFVPLDRDTGRPRGFAFVEFEDPGHASRAIQLLHEKPFKDRSLVVNEARPNEARHTGGARAPIGGGRAGSFARSGPPPGVGPPGEGAREERAPARRASPARSRRRGGKRGGWEDGPRKEPIPEKRRSQIFGGYDDIDDDEEDIEFENFATGLSDSEAADSEEDEQ